MIPPIEIKTPAKINAGLVVPFRYANGYHHIISYFISVHFYDNLRIGVNKSDRASLKWSHTLPDIYYQNLKDSFNNPEANLMIKTWNWLKVISKKNAKSKAVKDFFQKFSGIEIHIEKNIPSPSGLGGGSSNAAGIIRAFIELIRSDTGYDKKSEEDINQIIMASIELGSDIPFFLENQSALISGTGEINSRYKSPSITGIIGIPPFGFPTKQMYSALKKTLQTDSKTRFSLSKFHREFAYLIEFFANGFTAGNMPENSLIQVHERHIRLLNEFEDAAQIIFPEKMRVIIEAQNSCIEEFNENLIQPIVSMTGSGSAFFAITKPSNGSKEALRKIQKNLQNRIRDFHWVLI